MKLKNDLKNRLGKRISSYSYADQINESPFELNEESLKSFTLEGRNEILYSQAEKRRILQYKPSFLDKVANRIIPIKPKRTNGEFELDSVVKESEIVHKFNHDINAIEDLFNYYNSENNEIICRSFLLTAFRNTHKFPNEVVEFLEWTSENSSIELVEWSNLFLNEIVSNLPEKMTLLSEPISERDFVYSPELEFDVTMPLIFSGTAYTKIGMLTKSVQIPPLMFESVIGKAMALVRDDTFEQKMILQKTMYGIHPDGSPHYEIFPFLGTTEQIESNIHKHNYRTEVNRPYYSSGMTEYVGQRDHVIRDVKLSFERVGMTTTPEKYRVDGKKLVETVRGTFFGLGDINLNKLINNGFKLDNGNFQLTPKDNPLTKKPSNTVFRGIFYGKLIDYNNDNKLDVNTIPVNCDKDGNLDYSGDRTFKNDPFRPEDW